MTDYLYRSTDYNDPFIAPIFDELSFWSARFGLLLYENLELKHGFRILDLGCGSGFPLFELAHTCGSSCQVIGIDPWTGGLARANHKRKVYQLPHAHLINGDGGRLPFPDQHFDLIVSNLGINNFENPPVILAECARVIKPGSKLVLTTNLKGHMREFYRVFRAVLIDYGLPLDGVDRNEDHRGTRESVSDLLENAGFEVVESMEDEFMLRYLDGSAFFRHSLTRFGFLDGWRSAVPTDQHEIIFAEIESRLNEMAQQLGELKMTVPMLYIEGQRR